MPLDPLGLVPAIKPDTDRHGRRAVWIAALITMIGAGMIYADKAAEDRSAFIRWRHQVMEMTSVGQSLRDVRLSQPDDHANLVLPALGAARP